MPEIIEPRGLKGFRDYMPPDELSRRTVVERLERVLQLHGFVPIDTPVLEYAEVLLGKGGGETDKQVYRFTDHGGRDVAMRFDLTVPFARFMAAYGRSLALPFKRYHIAKVWRGENTQRGRYREFMQCDFDVVGVDNSSADLEILLLIRKSFEFLGIDRIKIEFSHRGVFNAFLERENLSDHSVEILRTVDKLSKVGRDKVTELLSEIAGEESAEHILAFVTPESEFEATLAKMRDLGGNHEGIERIEDLRRSLESLGVEAEFELNPSITRGLDYYTGLVFETFLVGIEGLGSVCSGGRYNDLASLYTKEQYAGVGASIGLDRLLSAIEEAGAAPAVPAIPSVLVMMLDERLTAHYHALAARLRDAGLSCEVFLDNKKLAQQFKFAERKGIIAAVICGSDEYKNGTVNVKDLVDRESYDGLTAVQAVATTSRIVARHTQ